MKGTSEARVAAALRDSDIPTLVIKLPDDARNWKPADHIAFSRLPQEHGGLTPAMFEVKDTPAVRWWPVKDLRPSQRGGIREATRIGMRYWVVIWWRTRKLWTVSDGQRILEAIEEPATPPTSLDYGWLRSVAGLDCSEADLGMVLRAVRLGEV